VALKTRRALVASGVTTSAERCIALLDNLAVDFLAIADLEYRHFAPRIVGVVYDAIIALPNPEAVGVSRQLFVSVWPGVVRERLNPLNNSNAIRFRSQPI
jgi:hypothetical protein